MKIRSPLEPRALKTPVIRAVFAAWIAFGFPQGAVPAQKDAREDPASGAARKLRIGETVESALESADPVLPGKGHYRRFRFLPRASGKITITMISPYFDAHLLVEDQDGDRIASDDNSGPGDGAELHFEVEAGEEYTVLAASSKEESTGRFKLEPRRGVVQKRNRGEEFARDREWYERVVSRSDISPGRRAAVLNKLGICRYNLDSPSEARRLWKRSRAILRKIGDRPGEAEVLGNLGNAAAYLGRPHEAIRYYRDAIAIYQRLDDEGGEAHVLGNLGNAYSHLGQPQRAVSYYKQALEIHHKRQDEDAAAHVLGNLGNAYKDLGRVEDATACYEDALKIHRKNDNRRAEAVVIGNLGILSGESGDRKREIQYYRKALKIHRDTNNLRSEGIVLGNLGSAYNDLGKPKEAIQYLQQALEIRRQSKDPRGQGIVLENLAVSHMKRGQTEEAIEHLEGALEFHRKASNVSGEVTTLRKLGDVYHDLADNRTAIEYYGDELAVRVKLRDLPGQAYVYAKLGVAYRDLAENRKAIEYYKRAFTLYRQGNNLRDAGWMLTEIGGAFSEIGQPEEAIEHQRRALQLQREVGDELAEAAVLNNLGISFGHIGRPEQAIKCYRKAVEIYSTRGDRKNEGLVLGNLGNVYRRLGQLEKALGFYDRALEAHRGSGNRREEGTVLVNMGIAFEQRHEHEKAAASYEKALPIHRETMDRRGEGICLYRLGVNHACSSQMEEAIGYYEKALAIHRQTGNRRHEGIVLRNLGEACRALDTPGKALEYHRMALDIHREVRNRPGEAATLWSLARLHVSQQRLSAARDAFQKASVLENEILEGVERGLEESAIRSRSSTLEADFADYFQLLIELHGQSESRRETDALAREAIELVEGLRARTLRGSMRAGDFRELLGTEGKKHWDGIRAVKETLSKLATRTGQGLPDGKEARAEALERLRSQTKRYEEEIATLERKLKAEEPKLASLFAGGTELDPATDLAGVLGEKELLLHYNVLGEGVAVFVWDREQGLDLHVLDVDARALGEEVATSFRALRKPEESVEALSELKERLGKLREKLFRGLESRIETARGLVFVPDAFLHLLPWETLVLEDGRYLIEKYRVRYAPSVHVLLELQEREETKADKHLVIFGDPDFGKVKGGDGPGVAVAVRGGRGFGELQHAASEVKGVSRLFRKKNVILRERREATEGLFKHEAGRGIALHVATHGRFAQSPGTARLPLFYSGLVFAGYNRGGVGDEDGFLTAAEVMGLDLRAVELAVLSACETAAGAIRGYEGKFGLERAFFVAGVKTFVGSLWRVDDRATSYLMRSFYQNLRTKGVTRTEALRKAKLDFISGRHKVAAGKDKNEGKTDDGKTGDGDRGFGRVPKGTRDLSHPYYWAPFILSGDGSSIR